MQFSLVENSAKERLHFIEFLICRPLPNSVLTFNEYIVTVFYLGSNDYKIISFSIYNQFLCIVNCHQLMWS